MNLLLRFFRFLLTLSFRVLLSLSVTFFRFLLPVCLRVLGLLRLLVATSLTATVRGPGQYTDRLAADWTWRLLDLGVGREYMDEIYALCRFLIFGMIFLGWVIATLFTVAILRVVFGYLF